MPYILENMVPDDIPEVAKIERLCFTMPWPTSAYRRELKTPETNRYIVERYIPPAEASRIGMPEPTEQNLTALFHPGITAPNGVASNSRSDPGLLSRWATLLPWLRHDETESLNGAGQQHGYPLSGYAGLWLMVDEAHVTTIGVHPSHRGQGAGELLFLGLVEIAQEMRAVRLSLEVRVSNHPAQALYRKYGLEIAGVRRRYYSDNGEDAYIMWSEPISSPEFRNRITRLRTQLTTRLNSSFHAEAPPAHFTDQPKLQ
jgi:ribosomal-protein-alanine N-acetyltransferase